MKAPYSIITLEQGSQEWLEWRHDGIGGSDAATIMGQNPYQKSSQLMKMKCSPPIRGRINPAMARGIALEPEVRSYYNDAKSIITEPQCLQSLEFEWLRASLDGITVDGSQAVEIKCGKSAYNITRNTRRPPKYYMGQFQHLMAVTGLESIDYCCYYPRCRTITLPIKRNQKYIDELLILEEQFWTKVIAKRNQ